MKKIAYLYISLVVLMWGSTAAVTKLLLKNLDAYQALFYNQLFAVLALLIILLFQKKFKDVKKFGLRDYWHFSYMGALGIFLYIGLFFMAMVRAPAQETFILNYTWPVWVIIFAMLILKEQFSAKKLAAIILSFIGVYVVATKGDVLAFSFSNLTGDLLALSAAVCYGLFSVLGKKQKYDVYLSMFFYYISGFVLIAITVLIFSSIPALSLYEFLGLLWLGAFTSGVSYVFWFMALKHGDTAKMSNFIFLTPFVSLVYIYLLLGETILISSIVGLLLIVAGIVIQSYKPSKRLKNEAKHH